MKFSPYIDPIFSGAKRPLIHGITNPVSAGFVADTILAVGGSPVMGEAPEEIEETVKKASALYINLGCLTREKIPVMEKAMAQGKMNRIPIVFDPVGVGATSFRTEWGRKLFQEYVPEVVRGNPSEVLALLGGASMTSGVDVHPNHRITEETLEEFLPKFQNFAAGNRTIIAVTGPMDLVTDGETSFIFNDGHPDMERITGTGCALSGLIAALCGKAPAHCLGATALGVGVMGLAGTIAYRRLSPEQGTGTFKVNLLDALSTMTKEDLLKEVNVEIRRSTTSPIRHHSG